MRSGACEVWLLIIGGVIVSGPAAAASDWPRFRGPNGTGIATDKDVPIQWTDQDGLLWKTPLPGVGNSSPIVWKGRIFLQSASADGKERRLLCLNAGDGKVLWSELVPGTRAHTHKKNTMASSTPATDGERVFTTFWDGHEVTLYAYDFQGKLLWKQALGTFTSQHGPGTSPMVWGDKVFITHDQDGASTLFALDARTGTIVWQAPRKPFRACYSTPFLLEAPGAQPELIVTSTAGITSYQPQNGEANWHWTWSFSGSPLRTVSSPVFSQGLIIATSGDGGGDRHMVAVKAGGKGDVTKTNLVWENKRLFPYVPCVLSWGEHLYYVNDKGFAGCHDARTGKSVWMERLGGEVTASPVLIDGKIYAVNEEGTVFVFPAAPAFKVLAKSSVGERVMATPAVADNRLLIRGAAHLFCIGKAPAK